MTLTKFLEKNPDKLLVRGGEIKTAGAWREELIAFADATAYNALCCEAKQEGKNILTIFETETKQWLKIFDVERLH
jgi:hypothetical protein